MRLSVQEAARLLNVSTKTIYRWVGEGRIPGYRVQKQYRFDRTELVEWATAQRMQVAPQIELDPDHHEEPLPAFDAALENGGVHYRLEGRTRDDVLRGAVTHLRLVDEADRDQLYEALRAREELASTAVGDGFALPHLRNPLRIEVRKPSVSLCFLEEPVAWGAPDGRPVSVLLLCVGQTVRQVLRLHSYSLFALRDEGFRRAVVEHGSRESILAEARRVTAAFASSTAS